MNAWNKTPRVCKRGIDGTNQQTNLWFKDIWRSINLPELLCYFSAKDLWGRAVFTLPGGHWSVHTLCQCLPSCHRCGGSRWCSASEDWCIGFFLDGWLFRRLPYAAGSMWGNSGSLDGSPSLLELCWSRVAPGEENKEEEEKEVRIEAEPCFQAAVASCLPGTCRDAQLHSSLSHGGRRSPCSSGGH